MKETLLKIPALKKLKRNEKLHANCSYILTSESIALNTYFQKKRDVMRAHKMFKQHLSACFDIVDYLFTPSGWMLYVITKTEEQILANIEVATYSSNKMRNAVKNKEIPVILSECIRYAIAGTTKKYNSSIGKVGAVVGQNFRRYIFSHAKIAIDVMQKMKDEQIELCWQKERYKPSMRSFNEDGALSASGDVYLCTKRHSGGLCGVDCQLIVKVVAKSNDVLRKSIELTKNKYFKKYKARNHPFFIQII